MLATLGICLALAATPDLPPHFVATQAFTIAWTHSIQKSRWEEDYSVRLDANKQPILIPGKARIKGSGAGMDPPPDAVKIPGGWYEYQPRTAPLHILRMTRSQFTADYEWCMQGVCQPMGKLLPSDGGVTLLRPCREPAQ